jgi:hypothetical protein
MTRIDSVSRFPRRATLTLALIATLLAPSAARATPVHGRGLPSLYDMQVALSEAPLDPLAPFQLALRSSVKIVQRTVSIDVHGYLRAQQDVYVHAALPSPDDADRPLKSDLGFELLEGDLYFLDGDRLVEASFLARDQRGNDHAVARLKERFGKPAFEVVLPGALSLVVGFRSANGFLMATFDDLPVFRISAFDHDPADAMAGSQMLLFEGLSEYSAQLRAGTPQSEAIRSLLQAVTEASMARGLLKPM